MRRSPCGPGSPPNSSSRLDRIYRFEEDPAIAAEYVQYIHPGGDDAAHGRSPAAPKQTLDAAKNALPLGGGGNRLGVIYLAAGSYTIGAPGSSVTGFNQDQSCHVVGAGPSEFGGTQ
ncbi:MAG: hypothetical protein J2P17_09580, partial [Mycobacterium sp.]|nr:hypothetical protein [Mycobacterium sp.]